MSERSIIEEVYSRPECFDAVWSESIEHYGVTTQSVVCMEECAELVEAIDDRRRDGLMDWTRAHLIEEMADVLICLWLLEHMYDVKGRSTRTYHPSPIGACVTLIMAISKILRYGTKEERLNELADTMEDVWRRLILLKDKNGIMPGELDEMIEYKTNRQAKRMFGMSERKDPHHG